MFVEYFVDANILIFEKIEVRLFYSGIFFCLYFDHASFKFRALSVLGEEMLNEQCSSKVHDYSEFPAEDKYETMSTINWLNYNKKRNKDKN